MSPKFLLLLGTHEVIQECSDPVDNFSNSHSPTPWLVKDWVALCFTGGSPGLLWIMVKSESESCPVLSDSLDYTDSILYSVDYTVHGILQARILEWVAFPFSSRSSQPKGLNPGLLHCRWILYQLSHKGSPRIPEWVAYPFSSRSSWPRNQTGVSCIAGSSLPTELSEKPESWWALLNYATFPCL